VSARHAAIVLAMVLAPAAVVVAVLWIQDARDHLTGWYDR
jgi:hypothetical protein